MTDSRLLNLLKNILNEMIVDGTYSLSRYSYELEDAIDSLEAKIMPNCECACESQAEHEQAGIQSALDAGIPLSVIEGRTKLSDHFSAEYIESKIKGEC